MIDTLVLDVIDTRSPRQDVGDGGGIGTWKP